LRGFEREGKEKRIVNVSPFLLHRAGQGREGREKRKRSSSRGGGSFWRVGRGVEGKGRKKKKEESRWGGGTSGSLGAPGKKKKKGIWQGGEKTSSLLTY